MENGTVTLDGGALKNQVDVVYQWQLQAGGVLRAGNLSFKLITVGLFGCLFGRSIKPFS